MVNTIVPIPGYVHLYCSLLRFYDMPENEIREMLYLLNTANLDCYAYYHPEVQLYKALLYLKRSVDRLSNIEYRFYKAYGMEIEDKRNVYSDCTYRLVPREDEPGVCLMQDWIYLPSA